MEKLKQIVEKFIVDNKLKFEGIGSGLNGNCVILAGFLCHIVMEDEEAERLDGVDVIRSLGLSPEAENELERVFNFAWCSNYEEFWTTEEAKEQYVF